MRINKYVAQATGLSRRAADQAIAGGRVKINGQPAQLGSEVEVSDDVSLDGTSIAAPQAPKTIMLNKPVGYVVSRNGQGSKTVYDLLPPEYQHLKPVGRLDKDSSGLLLMTSHGDLANELTHPSNLKNKTYEVKLAKPLESADEQIISSSGVQLDDGPSQLGLQPLGKDLTHWHVTMHEGRNRQIRRTFAARDYTVVSLHRISFGDYKLGQLPLGKYIDVSKNLLY